MNKSYEKSYHQLKRAWFILSELRRWGVLQFCLCPGGRNAPFVFLLSHLFFSKNIFHCFEERSAGFFAIGRIKKDLLPVVVVTTSGTAVGELLPSTMEAFYSKLPLVLLTADRPRSYRHSGAPQAVEQKGIFSNYVGYEFDLDEASSFSLQGVSQLKGPLHINVSFDEPLGDFSFKRIENFFKENTFHFSKKKRKQNRRQEQVQKQDQKKVDFYRKSLIEDGGLKAFFKKNKKPLILVGELPLSLRVGVENFLKSLPFPIYVEPLSGLRENKALSHQLLSSWEKVFGFKEFEVSVDSVLRIGGVPALRFWRDLEKKKEFLPVFNISHLPFKGLSRISSSPLPLEDFCFAMEEGVLSSKDFLTSELGIHHSREKDLKFLFEKDKSTREKIKILLKEFPFSEPGMLYQISFSVKEESSIFLGNSLPIREWDLAASRQKIFHCYGQRGTNGIDGLVSHFLGRACSRESGKIKEERGFEEEGEHEHWCIVGDLSTLYDLNALWMLKEFSHKSNKPLRIVVINNRGGKIFSRVFKNSSSFENQHRFSFYHWAKMFSCAYRKWSKASKKSFDFNSLPLEPLIIELNPSDRETKLFWKEFEKI